MDLAGQTNYTWLLCHPHMRHSLHAHQHAVQEWNGRKNLVHLTICILFGFKGKYDKHNNITITVDQPQFVVKDSMQGQETRQKYLHLLLYYFAHPALCFQSKKSFALSIDPLTILL